MNWVSLPSSGLVMNLYAYVLLELRRERRLIQQDLEALNLMNEFTSTDKLKPDVSQISSRSEILNQN